VARYTPQKTQFKCKNNKTAAANYPHFDDLFWLPNIHNNDILKNL